MRTIHKFRLTPGVDEVMSLDMRAKVLLVAEQDRQVTIWIERDPDAQTQESRTYAIIGTGHPIPRGAKHVGSAVCGIFVWHVYELA